LNKLIEQLSNRARLNKHIKTALLVGIILNLINQGQYLIRLDFVELNYFKFILTFFVPFAVSVYSAATVNNK